MKTAKQLFDEAIPDESVETSEHYEIPYFSDAAIIGLMEKYAALRYQQGRSDGWRDGYDQMQSNFRDLLGIENTAQ